MKKIFCLICCCICIQITLAQNLLVPVTNASLGQNEQKTYDFYLKDTTTMKMTVVQINTSAFNERQFTMSLFDEIYTVNVTNFVKRGENTFSLFGKINGFEGNVIFTVRDKNVIGKILINTQYYQVLTLGENKYILRKYDQRKYPGETCFVPKNSSDNTPANDPGDTVPGNNNSVYHSAKATGPSDCNLRIMVVYTAAAASAFFPDPVNAAQSFIDELNTCFDNSAVTQTAELAYAGITSFTESGDLQTDETRFETPADGFMDDVFTLRNVHSADLCILITNSTMVTPPVGFPFPACGVSAEIFADQDHSFAAIFSPCALSNITIPHEIGHLLGGRHNSDPATTPFAKGHGHEDVAHTWRTIMAVKTTCCTRIPYYTNPSVNFMGNPTSVDPTFQDMATVLNTTIPDAITFRQPPSTLTVSSLTLGAPVYSDILADNIIQTSSTVTINSVSDVTMTAGGAVILNPGLASGTNFLAHILPVEGDCPGDPNAGGIIHGGEDNNGNGNDNNVLVGIPHFVYDVKLYPNPTNSYATLLFKLAQSGDVKIEVYDVIGRLVRNIVDQNMKRGENKVIINTGSFTPGIYNVKLTKQGNAFSQRLTVVK